MTSQSSFPFSFAQMIGSFEFFRMLHLRQSSSMFQISLDPPNATGNLWSLWNPFTKLAWHQAHFPFCRIYKWSICFRLYVPPLSRSLFLLLFRTIFALALAPSGISDNFLSTAHPHEIVRPAISTRDKTLWCLPQVQIQRQSAPSFLLSITFNAVSLPKCFPVKSLTHESDLDCVPHTLHFVLVPCLSVLAKTSR